ncbi:unnamed protein product [Rotaria socialis]|uniref:Uncharacterized protein n=1 Tax=Rotaria socialis TaxID=392032 RepID=A0A818HW42_9BILA|nr:unnamed protein product [Rotaria socialis]
MSQRTPKRCLHVDIKRRWRSRKQENKINTFLDSAYHFDSTNTDEEEKNKTTPLYIGCPISVYEAYMRLIRLEHSLNLEKKEYKGF